MKIKQNNNFMQRILFSAQPIYWITAAFWLIAIIVSPHFRTLGTVNNVLNRVATLSLVSLGETLVIITGGFDLSVGSVMTFATCLASVIMPKSVFGGIASVLGLSLFVGTINGLAVTMLGVNPFIATLAMMSLVQGLAYVTHPGGPAGVIPESFMRLVAFRIGNFPVTASIIILMTAFLGWFVLRRTVLGRCIYAIGSAEEKARSSGIHTARVKVLVYALSGLAAGLAGLHLAGRIGTGDPRVGANFMIDAITAVILGGTPITGGEGGFGGTLAAAFIIVPLSSLLNLLGLSTWYQLTVKGCLLIIATGIQTYRLRRTMI